MAKKKKVAKKSKAKPKKKGSRKKAGKRPRKTKTTTEVVGNEETPAIASEEQVAKVLDDVVHKTEVPGEFVEDSKHQEPENEMQTHSSDDDFDNDDDDDNIEDEDDEGYF